jgi:hypothetical protein
VKIKYGEKIQEKYGKKNEKSTGKKVRREIRGKNVLRRNTVKKYRK